MRMLIMALALLCAAQGACALDANQVRGGWETRNGAGHVDRIIELRVVGDRVSGVYCTVCDDGTTVAFIDGQLGANDLTFTITHVRDDGSTLYQDHLSGRLQGDRLIVSGRSGAAGGGEFTWTMLRDPSGPLPPGPPAPVFHYQQPAAWEPLTADKLVGVWLSGEGPNKQYFTIRHYGNTLRGVVCGPCDNPYSMAAIENFFIQNDTVTWNICHEDHGYGPLPYIHQIVAHIARNELRLDATQPNIHRIVSMTLFGPLPYAATARSPIGEATTANAATARGAGGGGQ